MTRAPGVLTRVALVTAAAFVLSGHLALAQQNTTATSPPGAPAGISLVEQSSWVALHSEFVMRFHLDDLTLAARPNAAIAIRVYESADTRSGFDDVIANGALGRILFTPNLIPLRSLQQDAHHNVSVVMGLPGSHVTPTIGITQHGVYPVEVALTNTGVPSGSFVTWLVTVDTSSPNPIEKRLAVSFVWPAVADPATLPDGSRDPHVASEMRPGGRLDRIATLLARSRNFPVSLIVGPETARTWQDLARRDKRYAPGFARLRAAAARATTELMPTSYVPIDDSALEAAQLGTQLAAEYAAGARALRDALGTGPFDHAQAAFVDPASDGAVDRLRGMLVDRVAVRDANLVPITHPFSAAQTFVLDTDGGPARGAATAPFIEPLFDGNDPAALKAERVVAALAEVAYETPAIPRGIVIAPPARWNPDLAAMTTLVAALQSLPLVQPTTLDGFFTSVSNEQVDGVDIVRRIQPTSPAPTPLFAAEYTAAAAELTAYRDVVGPRDPVVVDGQQGLLRALSTSVARDRALGELARIHTAILTFTNSVTADAKRITLTARRASVPLGFVNALQPPRDVTVRVHLESAKLLFPKNDQIITLKPGSNTHRFDVEARASGTFPMTIRVTSADGALAFGAPVKVTVRSAVFGGAAVALTVAALVFLALWWANHFRRSRRARRLGATGAPAPAT